MEFKIEDKVKVNVKIVYKDKKGLSVTRTLVNENGVIKKIDGNFLYVKTNFGVHYLQAEKVKHEENS